MSKTIYVTSDSHHFHHKIIELCNRINPETGRPFSGVTEMNELMVKKWNAVVKKSDIVYHLGDFSCVHKDLINEVGEVLDSLHGEIHLIRGNHDHFPDEFYIGHNVAEVIPIATVINGVMLSHYPLFDDHHDKEFIRTDKLELWHLYEKNKCWFHLYGHAHQHPSPVMNAINVSVELHSYAPVRAVEILPHIGRFRMKKWEL